MTLKTKLRIYVVAVHVPVAAVLIWQREWLGWWLFGAEVLLVASLAAGLRWIHVALKPYEIAQALAGVIESGEFGTRYPELDHREIDRVIAAYNRMLANLQQEWLRLGEQRGFLERFLAVTPVGILIFDFDDRISLANPRACAMLGVAGDEELLGKSLTDVGSPLGESLAALGAGETRMINDAAGRRLRCQLSSFADRGFSRSYVLIEELTAELNRSERETYEKLIRMISHEVTNTVAATNSLLESCRNYAGELPDDEHRADYDNALNVLIERNRNLNEFTRGFSDLVKLPDPQRENVDVTELLRTMQTMFRADLEQRDIVLDVHASTGLPRVSMDKNQMDQVMINVIKNAAEAIERDGRIELVASCDGGYVDLSVIDNGAGLSESFRESLFQPFFTSKRDGQGLGLTLVKEILTQHGFAFSLDSAGGKTRFQIRMPGSVH